VALEMPPVLTWFTGQETVTRFIASNFFTEPGGLRLVPVTANGEPAFAVYGRQPGGEYRAHAMLVPTITPAGIAKIIAFQDLGLFELFGLPPERRD
jgi:RNA polymerase sigma-70 factor, ECF subfamily